MTRFFVGSAALALLASSAQAQDTIPTTPHACREMVVAYRTSVFNAAAAAKKAVDFPALEAGMIKRARECASRFNLNTLDPAEFPELGVLYVISDNVPAARQVFKRIIEDTTLPPQQRALGIVTAIQAMRMAYVADSGIVWAEKYLPMLDAFPGQAFEKFTARGAVIDYYLTYDIDDKVKTVASEMLALAKQMIPEQQNQHASGIASAYGGLAALYGSNLQADSALTLVRRAATDFPALDSILKPQLAPIIARYEMIGKKVPTLKADFWINDSASVESNQPTIIVFTANWCIPCRKSYPTLMKVNEMYKAQGLRTLVAVTLDGFFDGVSMEIPQEVEANKKYFTEKHKFPYSIAVQRNDDTAKASGPRNLEVYNVGTYPQYYVVDKQGILRAILMGWDPDGARAKTLDAAVRGVL